MKVQKKQETNNLFKELASLTKPKYVKMMEKLPYKQISDEGIIQTNQDTYQAFLKIRSEDLSELGQGNFMRISNKFWGFNNMYDQPYKIISLSFPTDSKTQQMFWERRQQQSLRELQECIDISEMVTTEYIHELATEQLIKAKNLSKNTIEMVFILVVYGSSIANIKKNIQTAVSSGGHELRLKLLGKRDATVLTKKLLDLNSSSFEFVRKNEGNIKSSLKRKEELESKGYDWDFLEKVQPSGGVSFHDSWWQTGNGYTQCLFVKELSEETGFRWLDNFMTDFAVSPYATTVSTIDVLPIAKDTVRRKITKAMGEHKSRLQGVQDSVDREETFEEIRQLEEFSTRLRDGEVPKQVKIRMYVSSASLTELENYSEYITRELSSINHHAVVSVFNTESEWQSLFQDGTEQETKFLSNKGFVLPAYNIGRGAFFNHKSHNDPYGFYLGQTSTDGSFVLDTFQVDKQRTSYSGFVIGKSGMGKSTTLKLILEGNLAKGSYLRGFDKNNEYKEFILQMGGTYIDLGGSKDSAINPLQIYPTVFEGDGESGKIDAYASVINHITFCSNQLSFISEVFTDDVALEFELLLVKFYISLGILPPEFEQYAKTSEDSTIERDELLEEKLMKIFDLKDNEFPLYGSFLEFMEKQMYDKETTTQERFTNLERLKSIVQSLVTKYQRVFNRLTTMPNLDDKKVVFYNLDKLTGDTGLMKAQLFSALNSIWASTLRNGKIQNQRRKQGAHPSELTNFFVLIDECHNILNTGNKHAVNHINTFVREMRKMLGAVFFATQSIEDMIPNENASEVADKIRSTFALCQTKILLNCDSAMIPDVKKLMGSTITNDELGRLMHLEKGSALVKLTSDETFQVQFALSPEQDARFNGGI